MNTPSELEHALEVPVSFDLTNSGQPAGETVGAFAAGSLIGFAELAGANGRRAGRMVHPYAGSR
jgi:hypothetical protein